MVQLLERQVLKSGLQDLSLNSTKSGEHNSAKYRLFFQILLGVVQVKFVLVESVCGASLFFLQRDAA